MRIRTIAILGIAAIVIAWGVARGALGRPSSVDRYIVNDGDTFLMVPKDCVFSLAKLGCPTQRLRLEGVDAFESKQTCRDARDMEWACGEAATERLRALTRRPDFTCRVDPEFVDRHAREFSLCFADGRDVGATMVNEGSRLRLWPRHELSAFGERGQGGQARRLGGPLHPAAIFPSGRDRLSGAYQVA